MIAVVMEGGSLVFGLGPLVLGLWSLAFGSLAFALRTLVLALMSLRLIDSTSHLQIGNWQSAIFNRPVSQSSTSGPRLRIESIRPSGQSENSNSEISDLLHHQFFDTSPFFGANSGSGSYGNGDCSLPSRATKKKGNPYSHNTDTQICVVRSKRTYQQEEAHVIR
jgi:hypothetical protein